MAWYDVLLGGVAGGLEKRAERKETGRSEQAEYDRQRGLLQLEAQLKQPGYDIQQREVEIQEKKAREGAIDNAYRRAQEIAEQYISLPDTGDKNPSVTARALAAEAFDNFMNSAGYPDVTFLGETAPEREEPEVAPTPDPTARPQIPSVLPKEAPQEARAGERGGQLVRRGMEAVGKLPSQAVGLGSTIYNLLAGGVTGATGMPQKTIGQPELDVMRKGELFNIPEALNYYMGLTKKRPPAAEAGRTRTQQRIIR